MLPLNQVEPHTQTQLLNFVASAAQLQAPRQLHFIQDGSLMHLVEGGCQSGLQFRVQLGLGQRIGCKMAAKSSCSGNGESEGTVDSEEWTDRSLRHSRT